jgi:hypothetical protein
MAFNKVFLSVTVGICAAMLAACASQPAAPAAAPASAPVTPAAPAPDSAVTEAQTATLMEKKFQEAARGYKTVQKDGKTMYCKRERVIGTTLPTLQCMTESQLRRQVESTEELKNRMRRGGGPCVQTGGGCSG